MQIVVSLGESPEFYIHAMLHRQARPPACCPNCKSPRRLMALGYYERGIASTITNTCLRFYVRRFRCSICGRTTSILPDFSQPYRLVPNQLITSFFSGKSSGPTQPWNHLLHRYWHRFSDWLPLLSEIVRTDHKLTLPDSRPQSAWTYLEGALGEICVATRKLTSISKVTVFGVYLCHQPCRCPHRIVEIHTTLLLRTGKDPPN
jgi:hypothetical protein